MQSTFRHSRHVCWGTYDSGRSNSRSLGGKLMRTADIAIASPPLGRLHQFGSVDLQGVSWIWGKVKSPIVPNEDYSKEGQESPSAKCSRGSLRCRQCVAGHHRAMAALQIEEASSRSTLPNWRRPPSGGQAMATSAGRVILPPRLWLWPVPESNPCVTYCNLLIFKIKSKEPCFLTSPSSLWWCRWIQCSEDKLLLN
jgi:hypothetical protein